MNEAPAKSVYRPADLLALARTLWGEARSERRSSSGRIRASGKNKAELLGGRDA